MEIGRIMIEVSSGKKLARLHLKKISQAWWCMPVMPAMQVAVDRRVTT
jgi:hypothetical protein